METKIYSNPEIKQVEFKKEDKVKTNLDLFQEALNKETPRLRNWYIKCMQCRSGKLVYLLCGDRLKKIKHEDGESKFPDNVPSDIEQFLKQYLKEEYFYAYQQFGFIKIDGEFPSGLKCTVATIDGSDSISCRWDLSDKYFNYHHRNGKTGTAKNLQERLEKYSYEKTDFDDYFFMSKALFAYEDKSKGLLDRYLNTVDAKIQSPEDLDPIINPLVEPQPPNPIDPPQPPNEIDPPNIDHPHPPSD